MTKIQRPLSAASSPLLLMLASCAVGPDYRPPETPMPVSWSEEVPADRSAHNVDEVGTEIEWWRTFNDPVLVELVERAVVPEKGNRDLVAAEARLRASRALYRQSISPLFPTVDADGSFSRSRRSQSTTQQNLSLAGDQVSERNSLGTVNVYSAGFDAVWELDIFGGTRRQIESAGAEADAAEARRDGVILSLIAEVARNYVRYRELGERLTITRSNIGLQEESLSLTDARFRAGLVSELDVTQAKAQLATTRSQVPSLYGEQQVVLHRLAVLTGGFEGDIAGMLAPEKAVPFSTLLPVLGVPSELLRRRPDISASERALAASTARIGVAVADLFPKFTLTGGFGYQSRESNTWFDSPSRFWSIVPGVRLPVFNAGALRAGVEIARAEEQQAFAGYEQTVLGAVEEAENALVLHEQELKRLDELIASRDANRRAKELSDELYREGLVDFLRVLEAQRSLYLIEDQVASSRATVMTQLIALYKAMGGGWEQIVEKKST